MHRGGGHVRVVGGRYMFPGGVVRVYKRPMIKHYYDVRMRPPIIVESYEPVAGYAWVGGNWRWGGAEWIWVPGYWQVAAEPPSVGISAGISAGVVVH
jgi:hypothetical protein